MVETQVIQNKIEQQESLDLTQLKTVKWVESNYVFQQGFKVADKQYKRMKGVTILAYLFAPIEMLFISFFLLIHQLPWPQFIMNIIYKIDIVIEEVLETIARKVEWWFDIVAVLMIRLRENLETLLDGVLSLMFFISNKVMDIWRWTITVMLGLLLWLFFPLIWIANKTLPIEKPVENEISESKSSVTDPNEACLIEDDKSSTSDCDSDVSIISGPWSIDHSARKNVNRVDMKATVEGRLRASMEKRVKTQLTIMRKNSIHFSKGVTIYARNIFEPTIPMLARFFKKLNLTKYYEIAVEWFKNLTSTSLFASQLHGWKLAMERVMLKKRKSKRTRSMRSESLRRVNLIAASGMLSPGIGLSQSTEPVIEENQVPCSLAPLNEITGKKEDTDNMLDSALPSSIDESSLNSDGGNNESSPSPNSPNSPNSPSSPTIVEEKHFLCQDSEEEFVKKAVAEFRSKKNDKIKGLGRMKSKSVQREKVSDTTSNLKGNLTKEGKTNKGKDHLTKKIAFSI